MYGIIVGISTILNQFKEWKKPSVLALFFLLAMVGWAGTFFSRSKNEEIRGVVGGPEVSYGQKDSELYQLASVDSFGGIQDIGVPAAMARGESDIEVAVLQDRSGSAMGISGESGIISYKIKRGDTIPKIAATFGVSEGTILAVNKGISSRTLSIGKIITILPTSGIIYTTKDQETAQSVAFSFNISLDDLKQYNRMVDFNAIDPGTKLIIPGATAQANSATGSSSGKLPLIKGYFKMPAEGLNWGKAHNYNAVDIANNCGTSVYASAEGLVVFDDSLGDGSTGWNGGYGHFVLMEHPNGTKTRYAHLDDVLVHVGDYVAQGKEVGTMGNTGNVHGPTGCHLHFEVYGAQNPFIKSE